MLVPFSAAGEDAAAGDQPELTLELQHHNAMGDSFVPVSATYLLDGKELLKLRGGALAERRLAPNLLRTPLPAGLHVLSIRLVYVGHSGLFKYVERYRFTMQGYLLIESRPGYGVKVISSAQEQKSVTVQWQNRPTFQVGGLPKKAILKVRLSPIERRAATEEDPESDLPPLTTLISEEDAKLLAEHLREEPQAAAAKPAAPQATPAKPAAEQAAPAKPAAAQVRLAAAGCEAVRLHFALGRASLDRSARRKLEELSACLLRAPGRRIRVEGHCDQRGSDALNDRLGQARAEAAAKFLVLRGVMPDRIDSASFGKRHPLCAEWTEECHAQNRRAELRDATPANASADLQER